VWIQVVLRPGISSVGAPLVASGYKNAQWFASNFVMYLLPMSDQCALNKLGSLKEAKDIDFFFSESGMTPLPCFATSLQCNPGNMGKSNFPLSL
jgi:hypothetical protein